MSTPVEGFAVISVVLAAGASTRMGRPKALLSLPDGAPIVRAWVERLLPLGPVTVVTGACHGPIVAAIAGRARVVENRRWAETGPLDSLRLAVVPGWTRCLVTPVDVPVASAAALARLVATPPPAALGHGGRPGHPILVDGASLDRLRAGECIEGGLRALLAPPAVVEAGPEALANLNTPEDWAAVYGSTS